MFCVVFLTVIVGSWTPESSKFVSKFGFYVKNPAQNRLETSQIRSLDQKTAKLIFNYVFVLLQLNRKFFETVRYPLRVTICYDFPSFSSTCNEERKISSFAIIFHVFRCYIVSGQSHSSQSISISFYNLIATV